MKKYWQAYWQGIVLYVMKILLAANATIAGAATATGIEGWTWINITAVFVLTGALIINGGWTKWSLKAKIY